MASLGKNMGKIIVSIRKKKNASCPDCRSGLGETARYRHAVKRAAARGSCRSEGSVNGVRSPLNIGGGDSVGVS